MINYDILDATAMYFSALLKQKKIKYTITSLYDGYQWKFDDYNGDIAIHSGTYYYDEGYVESYGMPWDKDDVSILSPQEAVRRLAGEDCACMIEREYTFEDTIESLIATIEITEA